MDSKYYWVCCLLCLIGIFKEYRPSEPYVTKFIVNYKNVTRETVIHVLYPISSYTYLATLPLIFLITDYLRYRLILVLECFTLVSCYSLLIWGQGLTNLKILEVLYGATSSAELAYSTYIYAKVDKCNFKAVTSYIQVALIFGNLIAAASAQLFVSFKLLNILELNYLTLSATGVATVLSLLLPPTSRSLYFNENGGRGSSVKKSLLVLWEDAKGSYGDSYLLKWSIWWALASGGNSLVRNYVQALWGKICGDNGGECELYNGAVDTTHSLLSVVGALSVGYLKINWKKYGEPFLTFTSFIQGVSLIWMSLTSSLPIAYLTYIFLRVSFQIMITVAAAEVALGLKLNSYGLIFGINKFSSLLITSALTFIITDQNGLSLNERSQFLVYGAYHFLIGLLFLVTWIIFKFRKRNEFNTSETLQRQEVENLNSPAKEDA